MPTTTVLLSLEVEIGDLPLAIQHTTAAAAEASGMTNQEASEALTDLIYSHSLAEAIVLRHVLDLGDTYRPGWFVRSASIIDARTRGR